MAMHSVKRRYLFICAALLIFTAVCVSLLFSSSTGVAFATDDTFTVVFPTKSYFQSENPTLIAANNDYLLVYDNTQRTLFAQSAKTVTYPLEFEQVENIFAVGNTAFIHADGGYYTIDLRNDSATAEQRELNSPDNITYFSSDGTYLYAKSVAGNISVYDENMEIASFGIDNKANGNLLSGHPVLAGKDGLLYVFAVVYGNPFLVKYNPATDEESNGISMDCYVTSAYIGDIIYAQVSTVSGEIGERNIIGIDKQSGEVLFSSDVTPDSFYAYGDRLFSIEGKRIVIYTLKDDRSGFNTFSTISMAGNDLNHLDSPNDVVRLENKLVVADGNNNRLCYIEGVSAMKEISLDSSPLRLAVDASGVYALCKNNKIYRVVGTQITQTYDASGAIDIAYLDKLYILKSDGLYASLGGGIIKLSSFTGGKRIAYAKDGTSLYILNGDSVTMLSKDGSEIMTLSLIDEDAKDIAVDYAGQLIVIYADKIATYSNGLTSFDKTGETPLKSSFRVNANSAYLAGDTLYFSADECLIGKMTVDCVDKESYEFTQYSPTGNESYYFAKLKDDVNSYILQSDGRPDGVASAPNETVMILGSADEVGENLCYALLNGKTFICVENDFNEVRTTTLSGEYVTSVKTTLYKLPNISAGKISANKGVRFTLASDCADFEGGKWLRINYGGSVYFIKASDCDKYTYVKPESERIYGKAKATRVGGLVSIYSSTGKNAKSLTQIVDGTQIEILEDVGDYYLVNYEDIYGYMLKDEVQLKGLTSVQIIAIVLAVFVALTGICIFIIIEVTKKKDDEKAQKAERKN